MKVSPIFKRALLIAAAWGLPVTVFSTMQSVARNLPQPHIRTLAEMAPARAKAQAQAKTSILGSSPSSWQGPLPLVAGAEWQGNPDRGVLTATFSDAEWFVPGSVTLNLVGRTAIRQIREALAALPASEDRLSLSIEAHSDSSPVVRLKARFPTNWELTGARAFAVVRELHALGIPSSHLSGTGLADSRPVSTLQALNRRIQLTVRFNPPTLLKWEVAQR